MRGLLGIRLFQNLIMIAFFRFRPCPFAPLGNKCSNATSQELRQEITNPIKRRLNENFEQHHVDDGERDHSRKKGALMRARSCLL